MQAVSFRPTSTANVDKVKKEKRFGQLTAYTETPNIEFTIDDFEEYAIARLNVLRWIEKQTGLGMPIADKIHGMMELNKLDTPLHDEISHFIGRLCFCQTAERRKWFLNTEKILFETRYKLASATQRTVVHQQLCGGNTSYQTLHKSDIIANEDLNGKAPIPKYQSTVKRANEEEQLPFYKVPFAEVMPLVGRRSVFLLDGYAYVPHSKFSSIITGKFRSFLNHGLVSAQRALNKMRHDPMTADCIARVYHIIDGLYKITNDPSYRVKQGVNARVTHKNVHALSNTHFPLCMQSSMDHMKADGHLKHGGRMHLGLFLKGIGLSLNEAMIFWRNSFSKVGADKFNKNYAYNIRHNYGKEGKRIDYTPYACHKIISCSPNNGDYHGCPFKIFDAAHLRQYLMMHKKMSGSDVDGVLRFVEQNHYQLACRQFFDVQHRAVMKRKKIQIDGVESSWSHPNEYFDASYKLYYGEEQQTQNAADENNENVQTNNGGSATGTQIQSDSSNAMNVD